MTKKILFAFACLGLAVTAGAEVNFDKGVDVKSAVKQVEKNTSKDLYPNAGYPYHSYFSRDCRNFSFGPSASAIASERVYLASTEYVRECRMVHYQVCRTVQVQQCHTAYKPGPNGTQVPYQQCVSVPKQECHMEQRQECHDRPGQTFRTTAQLNIAQRQLFPWERESFSVCMEGPRVNVVPTASPYSYGVDQVGLYDITFNMRPNYRVPTNPDPNGLNYAAFSFKDGKFTLSVTDRWTNEYAGEKVAIKIELMKDGFWFFNSSKGEKTFTFATANGYDLVFAEGDLTKNKDFVDDSADKGPAKFYVKWGFQRLGKVSTDQYVKKDESPKIPM
ncbi:MAG TPA: hypothetical protein DCZ92_15495 [Elusimicrobia bacterium]|nr:hypothetical protein [Elusimicrobiota bacterium]